MRSIVGIFCYPVIPDLVVGTKAGTPGLVRTPDASSVSSESVIARDVRPDIANNASRGPIPFCMGLSHRSSGRGHRAEICKIPAAAGRGVEQGAGIALLRTGQ